MFTSVSISVQTSQYARKIKNNGALKVSLAIKVVLLFLLIQWRVQDFSWEGTPTMLEGMAVSDVVTFQQVCMSKQNNWDPLHGVRASGVLAWIRHC